MFTVLKLNVSFVNCFVFLLKELQAAHLIPYLSWPCENHAKETKLSKQLFQVGWFGTANEDQNNT